MTQPAHDNKPNTERDSFDQILRDGAQLVIVKPDYAYISFGNARYYFSGKATQEKVTLYGGDEVVRTTLPYDGWERGI